MSLFANVKRITIVVLSLVMLIMVGGRIWTSATDHTLPESRDKPTAEAPPRKLLEKSIAILPFIDLGAGPENIPFLAEGLHDELLTRLSKIPGLKVIARPSVMAYRDSTKSLRIIGEELGATNLLEGSVLQSGKQVSINLQLISTHTAEPVLAMTWERALTVEDIFQIQDEMTRSIGGLFEDSSKPKYDENPAPTSNFGAYQAVLIARQLGHRTEFAALSTAIEHSRKAIALDPAYVDAHIALAGLLNSGVRQGFYNLEDVREELSGALQQARSLDPENSRAWSELASYQLITGDTARAEPSFERALEREPGHVETLREYGNALLSNGMPDKALPLLLRAGELDPVSPATLLAVGSVYHSLDRNNEARAVFARIRELAPSSPLGFTAQSWSLLTEGRLDDALYWLGQAQTLDPQDAELGGWIVFLNDCLEDYIAAKEWSDWLADRVTNQPQPMAMQARHHYLTGHFELALQYSNLALRLGLPDRGNSDAIFMRIKRDEALANGNPESGIKVFAAHHPQLLEKQPVVTARNIEQATDLALLLKLAGRREEAQRLLSTVISTYDQPFFTSVPFRISVIPVKAEALSMLGDEPGALAELKRIIDQGWRTYWRWKTDLNPNFDGIRESDEFQILVGDLEADMTRQRLRVQDMAEHGEIAPPPETKG